MRITKAVVRERIDTSEDLVIAVDSVRFEQDVRCGNIVSEGYKRNIDALDIVAWDIVARDIDADFVVCDRRIKKSEKNKTVCKSLIINRSKLVQKEQLSKKKEVKK